MSKDINRSDKKGKQGKWLLEVKGEGKENIITYECFYINNIEVGFAMTCYNVTNSTHKKFYIR